MAIGVLILGESGTGKTYSLHNFNEDEVKILSVEKPILPFRKKLELVKTPTEKDIIKEMKNTNKKVIVVDDFQYILGLSMMKRSLEKGWDKYNEIQFDYFKVLETLKELPDDVIVIFNSHIETTEDGLTKVKTIGKALDKYITIEGLFMIVLGTLVTDGKYYFTTQNNGKNTIKSPDGMFPSFAIDNDLKYVVEKIRNYYYMDGAKSDEEMTKADEEVKSEVEEPTTKKRKSRTDKRQEKIDKAVEEVANGREEAEFDAVMEKVEHYYYDEENDNYIKSMDDKDLKEITKEEFEAGIKRLSQETQQPTTRKRRTRRA